MQRRFAWAGGVVLGIVLFLMSSRAEAVITRLISLRNMLKESQFIVAAKVASVLPDKPGLVLTVDTQFKGKFPVKKLSINLTGDNEAKKNKHTSLLLKRVAPKVPVILFINQRGKQYTVMAFSNGTWFQVVGRKAADSDAVGWSFTHCEPYLRRTFAGTTAELKQIVKNGLAGKKQPPEPNAKEKPGLGPEVKKAEKKQSRIEDRGSRIEDQGSILGPPFAVIPTIGIGGPLAILAMLFPAVFGGALVVFRNWVALLTVASINSTLLVVYLWFGRSLGVSWLGTPQGLWFAMLLVTLAGTLWAWRRQLHTPQIPAQHQASSGVSEKPRYPFGTASSSQSVRRQMRNPFIKAAPPNSGLPMYAGPAGSPTRSELVIVWSASLIFLGSFLYCCLGKLAPDDPTWRLLLVFTVGFVAGGLYLGFHCLAGPPRFSRKPALATEGIVLWSMVVAATCVAAAWPNRPGNASFEINKDRPVITVWTATLPQGGFIVSSCLVQGKRVYVAAAHRQGADMFGALYCLDAVTGEIVWKFDDDGAMKQVFSSPCIADGRLFIGEGFHTDASCKFYCVDANSGKKLWDFQTNSHTESSPCVAGDKVFFGAGDDGVYCVNAKNGKRVWQYPGPDGDTSPTVGNGGKVSSGSKPRLKLHVDANPLVVGDRLYVSSGIDRDAQDPGDPAVFCLDVKTGKRIWLLALGRRNLPAWGSAVAAGDQVYFGLGNGNLYTDEENPAGALLCVDRKTGTEQWRVNLSNGVLNRPAVDPFRVYFGCRDGFCYCVDRKDGQLRWKNDLGSPVLASPALFRCPECGTARLYAMGTAGRLRSFDPETGFVFWTFDLEKGALAGSAPFVAVDRTAQGERRRIYFGAGLNDGSVAPVYCLEDK
jgi:outer membrane protein assembly factor BamB